MTDPLSIAAGIVGITYPALHVTKALIIDINNIIDAPEVIETLRDDIELTTATLESISSVDVVDWEVFGTAAITSIKTTIESCTKSCTRFQGDLQKWVDGSENGKLSWKARAKIGVFQRSQIKSVSESLQNCKASLSAAVGTAILHSSVRNNRVTNDIKELVSAKETEITKTIEMNNAQLEELQRTFNETVAADIEEGQDDENYRSAVAQLSEEIRGIKASQEMYSELLSKALKDMGRKGGASNINPIFNTYATFGANNKGFQVGNQLSGMHFGSK